MGKVVRADGGRVVCLDATGVIPDDVVDALAADELAVTTVEEVSDGLDRLASTDCFVCVHDPRVVDAVTVLTTIRRTHPVFPFVLVDRTDDAEVARRAIANDVSGYLPLTDGVVTPELLREEIERATEPRETRRWAHVDAMHEVALEFEHCADPSDAYDLAVEAGQYVLDADASALYIAEDGSLEPKALSGSMVDEETVHYGVEEGVAGKTFQTGTSTLIRNVAENPDAEPISEEIRSGISVPVGTLGVLQLVSTEPAAFTRRDVTLAELLASNVSASVRRVRSQREVARERDRFAALFETVPDPVVLAREPGSKEILDVNPAFEDVFGYEQSTVAGRALEEFVVPPGESSVHIYDSVGVGEPIVEEVTRKTVDGTREFLLRGFATEADGAVFEYTIYTDVSEQKRREYELERQNRRLETFATTLSHDLRNPLTLATGRLELAQKVSENSDVVEHVTEASWALDRMDDLAEDVLTLAHSGQRVTEREPVDVEDALGRAIRTIDAEIDVDVGENLPTVEADEGRLVALFENLLVNARTHAGDDVTVSVTRTNVGFAIDDDGPGISPGERGKVLESGYTTDPDGTGFGLAIVSEVVDAHGWSLSLGESDDGGVRFEISVPREAYAERR